MSRCLIDGKNGKYRDDVFLYLSESDKTFIENSTFRNIKMRSLFSLSNNEYVEIRSSKMEYNELNYAFSIFRCPAVKIVDFTATYSTFKENFVFNFAKVSNFEILDFRIDSVLIKDLELFSFHRSQGVFD